MLKNKSNINLILLINSLILVHFHLIKNKMVEARADQCVICKHKFDESDHYPFMLFPCGDTVCKICKTRLEAGDRKCTP